MMGKTRGKVEQKEDIFLDLGYVIYSGILLGKRNLMLKYRGETF